jgi:hypothetical protein
MPCFSPSLVAVSDQQHKLLKQALTFYHGRLCHITSACCTYGHQLDRILGSVRGNHVSVLDIGSFGIHNNSHLLVLHGGSTDIPLAADDPLLAIQLVPGQEKEHTSSSNRFV